MRFCQRRKVKDFFIKFTKKSHFADFLTEHTLDFVLHCLFCGLAEMDTDDIGGLADLLSDSRASGGVCDVTRSVSKMTEIERRGGKRWDKPKKAEKSRDCGGGKF